VRCAVVVICLAFATAHADTEPKPIVGFRVRGDSKLRERTLGFLSHLALGDLVSDSSIPAIEQALKTSELFEKITVRLEDAPGGVLVVAELKDKHSWFAAPTLYVLGERRAVGVGFIENNLLGYNQKILAYGQYGTHESILFLTYLDPSVSGTPFAWRFDLYGYRRQIDEYANPSGDATNDSILRTTNVDYLGLGFQAGWTWAWYLVTDLRLRGGKNTYSDPHAPDGTALLVPQDDGWDVTTQARITFDARHSDFGVRWGPYLQLYAEQSIPGLDDYDYSSVLLRAYYGWRLFGDHQLELRTNIAKGRNLPLHDDLVIGGSTDLRGYAVDRFRGDTRLFGRVEYSFPLAKWRIFSFRGLGFFDSGFMGIYNPRKDVLDGGDRSFFYPNMEDGAHWFRNDVGAGLRIYVKKVVLPLFGFDVAYGIEGEAARFVLQLGLVDF
jgi:outer membrane protein assembly factor BamA